MSASLKSGCMSSPTMQNAQKRARTFFKFSCWFVAVFCPLR